MDSKLINNRHQNRRCWSLVPMCSWCVLVYLLHTYLSAGLRHTDISLQYSSSVILSGLSQSRLALQSSLHSVRPSKYVDKIDPSISLQTLENNTDDDPCAGKYVYIHRLPSLYNDDILAGCRDDQIPSTKLCKLVFNTGLGPQLEDETGVVSSNGWYATDQFALDVIFHNRMKQYKCLTNDSSKAVLIYVPFYGGLDVSRSLWDANVSARDSLSTSLDRWLQEQPEWRVMDGKDHFIVCGRMTWDFRRRPGANSGWGNSLLNLPALQNTSTLLIEKSPWNTNDFGIPYPTYFHPSSDSDVLEWQHRMRSRDRPALFSFAGAPRPEIGHSIREELIKQCNESKVCTLLQCHRGTSKCNSPMSVMKLFQESVFCLQPQGDSFTRRSLFDSMVAGCIPVLFHPYSAYTQYIWHLPQNYNTYSVFIKEEDIKTKNVNIEGILDRISPEQIYKMREKVISLIPSLIYADPRHSTMDIKDASVVAVEALIDMVSQSKTKLREGSQLEDNVYRRQEIGK